MTHLCTAEQRKCPGVAYVLRRPLCDPASPFTHYVRSSACDTAVAVFDFFSGDVVLPLLYRVWFRGTSFVRTCNGILVFSTPMCVVLVPQSVELSIVLPLFLLPLFSEVLSTSDFTCIFDMTFLCLLIIFERSIQQSRTSSLDSRGTWLELGIVVWGSTGSRWFVLHV